MLSPNPLHLLCALLLCLPLALVLTITGNYTPSSTESTIVNPRLTFLSFPSNFRPPPLPLCKAIQNPPPPATPSAPNLVTPELSSRAVTRRRSSNETTNTNHRPPPSLFDDKEDEALFKRASRVNSDPKPTRPMKIAFMFLTTTAPLPFAAVWEKFFMNRSRSYYNIYIHADPSITSVRFNRTSSGFTGIFTNRTIPSSKPTRRHTPTLISAARRLLSHALLEDPSNSMFALLSDSCIPLHSFTFTYKTLITANSGRKSFIEILKNETGSYGRWAARGESAMLPQVRLDAFRIGSQFWVLTRNHARMVVKDEKKLWEKFKLPCVDVTACYPEENYFPTMLSMLDPRGIVPATLTHVDWNGRFDGHPRTYNESEVGKELIERLRGERPRYGDFGVAKEEAKGTMTMTSGSNHVRSEGKKGGGHPFLFARKFGNGCVQRLLSIADNVIFKD